MGINATKSILKEQLEEYGDKLHWDKHIHVHQMMIQIQKSLAKDAETFKTSYKSQSNVSFTVFSLRRAQTLDNSYCVLYL